MKNEMKLRHVSPVIHLQMILILSRNRRKREQKAGVYAVRKICETNELNDKNCGRPVSHLCL